MFDWFRILRYGPRSVLELMMCMINNNIFNSISHNKCLQSGSCWVRARGCAFFLNRTHSMLYFSVMLQCDQLWWAYTLQLSSSYSRLNHWIHSNEFVAVEALVQFPDHRPYEIMLLVLLLLYIKCIVRSFHLFILQSALPLNFSLNECLCALYFV